MSKKIASYLSNRMSMTGLLVAVISMIMTIVLGYQHLIFGEQGPYRSIAAWLVFPSIFWIGLVILVFGAVRERRRRHRKMPDSVPRRVRIDLEPKAFRRLFLAGFSLVLLLVAWGSFTSFHAYEFTESTEFCASTCHVMQPEKMAHQVSPHANVSCADCHVEHTPSGYVESKLFGLKELYWLATDSYQRPIQVPIRALKPVRQNCVGCHWEGKYWGKMHRDYSHFITARDNELWTLRMNVKVGGTHRIGGNGEGIHWHMRLAPKVFYVASDQKLQTIPWIKVVHEDGEEFIYQSTEDPISPEQLQELEMRQMDCADCHNRPAHQYKAPLFALDEALRRGLMDPALPEIKVKAAELLAADGYESQAEATRVIEESLINYYREEQPEVWAEQENAVRQAAQTTVMIYRQNFFPEMRVDWRQYPDNIGHFVSDGCFRCHDGQHETADGQVLSNACSDCHDIVAQGPPGEVEQDINGLEFRHPVDFGVPASELGKCTACHDGSLQNL